jgi:hypothetical protein
LIVYEPDFGTHITDTPSKIRFENDLSPLGSRSWSRAVRPIWRWCCGP